MSKDKKVVEITNAQAGFLVQKLSELKVSDKIAFSRRRFIRSLKENLEDLEIVKNELREQHFEKDEKGDFKVSNNKYTFKNSITEKQFNKKWNDLFESSFKVDITDANHDDFVCMAGVVSEEIERIVSSKKEFDANEYENIANLKEVYEVIKI